jgi:methylmalonyl-CoA mutase
LADPVTSLAQLFPPASRADWLALTRRALKGKPLEALESRTSDGIVIAPLHSPGEAPPPQPLDRARRAGERNWDIRAPVSHPDVAGANAEILEALGGGAASVLVALDPTGEGGVAIGGAGDVARLVDGVLTDIAPVAADAGFLGPQVATWLSLATKASPVAPLCFHLDPLSALARSGVSPGAIENHVAASANVAARLAATHPRASLFLASGVVAHEAGASEACEIAFAGACALAYARALETAGVAPAQALARIVLGLAVDGDPLVSIAKLRAARIVWRRITQACGAPSRALIEARSSRRMLTAIDPWTNLVRLTAAALAAAAGGADTIVLGTFTDAVGRPTPLARRLARNTGLILMEESHVGTVADPAGGSWAFESLSVQMARAAWEKLTRIEAVGGAAAALTGGLIGGWLEEGRQLLQAGLAGGARKIIGVNVFRPESDTAVEVEPASPRPVPAPDARLAGADSRCPPLAPIRLEDLAP